MPEKKRNLIYLRYLYPSVSMLVLFIFMFIPSYSFVTSSGVNDPVSLAVLAGNAWEWSVQCLFGGGIEQTAGNIYFSQTTMILVAVGYLLFAIALGVAIYLAVTAFLCFGKSENSENNRIIFVTFFFNRVVVSVLHALALPVFLFPRLLPSLYLDLLGTYVEIRLEFIDPFILAFVVFLLGVVLSIMTANWERGLGMDVFAGIRENKSVEVKSTPKSVSQSKETPFEEMSRKAKEEQTERIIKLLNKDKEE